MVFHLYILLNINKFSQHKYVLLIFILANFIITLTKILNAFIFNFKGAFWRNTKYLRSFISKILYKRLKHKWEPNKYILIAHHNFLAKPVTIFRHCPVTCKLKFCIKSLKKWYRFLVPSGANFCKKYRNLDFVQNKN